MSRGKFTVRHGLAVIHCLDQEAMREALEVLDAGKRLVEFPHKVNDSTLLGVVAVAANQVNSVLVKAFRLNGPARKCLGTALRVRGVRAALPDPLLRTANYLADAADALRHINDASLKLFLDEFSVWIDAVEPSCLPPHPVFASDPWTGSSLPPVGPTRTGNEVDPWAAWAPCAPVPFGTDEVIGKSESAALDSGAGDSDDPGKPKDNYTEESSSLLLDSTHVLAARLSVVESRIGELSAGRAPQAPPDVASLSRLLDSQANAILGKIEEMECTMAKKIEGKLERISLLESGRRSTDGDAFADAQRHDLEEQNKGGNLDVRLP